MIVQRKDTVQITEKEMQIIRGLQNDATVTEIAQDLNISRRTIEGRVQHLKAKTGVKTLHGLLCLFYQSGLIK